MATASVSPLVEKLPIRLRNFFCRYPPQRYSAAVRPSSSELQSQPNAIGGAEAAGAAAAESAETPSETQTQIQTETGPLPSPYTPNREAKGYEPPNPRELASHALLWSDSKHPNPFLPRKNFKTGKWISPRYGLREQADLVKLAIKYNVEALLPPGKKSTEYKETRRAERGLAIKGTGIGQKVKGHKWERTMEGRLEDRRKAMMEMPEMIRLWKQRGHGRGWKKWPKR
ncbi:hypothetical protein BDV18DRAFT_161983 [Aspergillus unguis]